MLILSLWSWCPCWCRRTLGTASRRYWWAFPRTALPARMHSCSVSFHSCRPISWRPLECVDTPRPKLKGEVLVMLIEAKQLILLFCWRRRRNENQYGKHVKLIKAIHSTPIHPSRASPRKGSLLCKFYAVSTASLIDTYSRAKNWGKLQIQQRHLFSFQC